MKYLIILICVIYNLKVCNGQCTFERFDENYPPLFLNKYDDESYNLLQHLNERISVLEGAELIGFCPGGLLLRDPDILTAPPKILEGIEQMRLTCVENKLIIELDQIYNEEAEFMEHNGNNLVACTNYGEIKLYENMDADGCNYHNYAVTIKAVNITIILAECCFDLETLKFRYIHFTARSSGLTYLNQVKKFVESDNRNEDHDDDFDILNDNEEETTVSDVQMEAPSNIQQQNLPVQLEDDDENMYGGGRRKRQQILLPGRTLDRNQHDLINTTIPMKVFFFTNKEFEATLPTLVPYKHLVYLPADLFPQEALYPYFTNPFINIAIIQKFIGWRNLVLGNWREFNKLLAVQAGEEGSYEVYTGISHLTLAPIIAQNCVKKIKIESEYKIKHAPQYVWTYLIDNYGKEEFVVIGFNSPFHEFFESSARPLCNDMCDRIPWMKPLQIARKVYNFGYLICCLPDEVAKVLHGFPKIRSKHVFTFE